MEQDSVQNGPAQNIVIVTGPAGAGRRTAINALEDLGYETIDNLPLNLFSRLLSGPPEGQPLAIGVDASTRGFSVDALLDLLSGIGQNPGYSVSMVYLDCSREVLLRRFSETRRRHPQALDKTPDLGIKREKELLRGLRDRADLLLDTSEMSPHDLRDQCSRWFSTRKTAQLSISVQSFSYKRGIPHGVDMVIDCRFLNNPHWQANLRPMTGLNEAVAEYVMLDPRYDAFFNKLCDLLNLLLPAYRNEGKSYFSIAMGCTGGRHRSVCVAEGLKVSLENEGWLVSTRHREAENWQLTDEGKKQE